MPKKHTISVNILDVGGGGAFVEIPVKTGEMGV